MQPTNLPFGVIGVGPHRQDPHRESSQSDPRRRSDGRLLRGRRRTGRDRVQIRNRAHLRRPPRIAGPRRSGRRSHLQPTDQHYQTIVDAAVRGKQIFCEKPIDLSLEKVQAANREVAGRGVRMMVAFNRRYDPNFLKVRESIAAGLIGQPQILRITSRDPGPPPEQYIRACGGIFLDMTIHDFDMARYLMGSEVTEVYARAAVFVDPMIAQAGDFDTAVITLTFEKGAFAVIDNSRKAAYGYDQRVEMFGSGGMVAIANNTPDTHILCDRAGIHTSLPLNYFLERYAESYRLEMCAFIDAVVKQKPVPVGGEDGFKAVVIALPPAYPLAKTVP